MGYTCFMNAAIAAVFASPPLRNTIVAMAQNAVRLPGGLASRNPGPFGHSSSFAAGFSGHDDKYPPIHRSQTVSGFFYSVTG